MEFAQIGTKETVKILTYADLHTKRWKHADMQSFAQEQIADTGMIFLANSLF